jgi:hypothetical protein
MCTISLYASSITCSSRAKSVSRIDEMTSRRVPFTMWPLCGQFAPLNFSFLWSVGLGTCVAFSRAIQRPVIRTHPVQGGTHAVSERGPRQLRIKAVAVARPKKKSFTHVRVRVFLLAERTQYWNHLLRARVWPAAATSPTLLAWHHRMMRRYCSDLSRRRAERRTSTERKYPTERSRRRQILYCN